MIVVKVGGSLFDLPDLKSRLIRFLEPLHDVHVIPGGGRFADAVRNLDRIHMLGEESSHWLAVRSMSLSTLFLKTLLDSLPVTIVDVEPWLREHDTVPHSWDVTSDSLAAHYASEMKADELILLKSTDSRSAAVVDRAFSAFANRLKVQVVNLRA